MEEEIDNRNYLDCKEGTYMIMQAKVFWKLENTDKENWALYVSISDKFIKLANVYKSNNNWFREKSFKSWKSLIEAKIDTEKDLNVIPDDAVNEELLEELEKIREQSEYRRQLVEELRESIHKTTDRSHKCHCENKKKENELRKYKRALDIACSRLANENETTKDWVKYCLLRANKDNL